MKTDSISIVEAAYDCEGDRRAWFRRILEVAGPSLDRGFGVSISAYTPNMRPEELSIETTMAEEVAGALIALTAADPENLSRTFAPSLAPHGTASSRL